jgi:hypothetical protein
MRMSGSCAARAMQDGPSSASGDGKRPATAPRPPGWRLELAAGHRMEGQLAGLTRAISFADILVQGMAFHQHAQHRAKGHRHRHHGAVGLGEHAVAGHRGGSAAGSRA